MPESNPKSELRAKLVKYAANILSRRPYFRHQLKQKLFLYAEKFGLSPDSSTVDQIITDLAQSGYLDDQYLAAAYVRRQLGKCYGPKIIRYKLKTLGLSDTLINQALASEATAEALLLATDKISLKYRSKDPREVKQKLYQRGF